MRTGGDLGAWARANGGRLAEARAALDAMPPREGKPGWVEPPMPYVDRAWYKSRFTNRQINRAIGEAPVVSVPLEGLRKIQRSVSKERVLQYISHPGMARGSVGRAGNPTNVPIIVKYRGLRLTHDGHHRCVAAMLEGKKKIRARLVDLDALLAA